MLFQGEDKAPGRGDSAAEDTAAPWLWKALSTQGGLQGNASTDTRQLLSDPSKAAGRSERWEK